MKNDIILISTSDWQGIWYQRQHLACQFAGHGHKVFYFNRTLQRWPTFEHLFTRFKLNKPLINKVDTPENLTQITPLVGPPLKALRSINKLILKRLISNYDFHDPVVITYLPTYIALDLIELIDPVSVVYVNDHYYEAIPMPIIPELFESERELIRIADLVFGDSIFNCERLSKLSNGKKVYRSMPGVYSDLFFQAYRGDETVRPKKLFYFGLAKEYLNIDLYLELSQHLQIVFVGSVDEKVRNKIAGQIEIRPPVFNKDLPEVLKEADIIGLFYQNNEFMQSVFPAKLFESIATCKPLLVSGLKEAKPYSDIVYDVNDSSETALEIISKLQKTESKRKIEQRRKIASEADWSNRYNQFSNYINETLNSKTQITDV